MGHQICTPASPTLQVGLRSQRSGYPVPVSPPAHRLWWSSSVWEGSGLNLTVTSVIEALVSLSRFPWWCHVSQVFLDPSSLCTVCLQSVIFVFLGVHTAILLCWFIPYTQHLFPPVLLFLSFLPFSPFKGFFWFEFFHIWIEGLRIERVVYCTDCQDPWGKFVIWDIWLYK